MGRILVGRWSRWEKGWESRPTVSGSKEDVATMMATRMPKLLGRSTTSRGRKRLHVRVEAGGSTKEKVMRRIKAVAKPLGAAALALAVALHPVDAAYAARSSGRMGGRSFHSARSHQPSSSSYTSSSSRSTGLAGKHASRTGTATPSTSTFAWGFFPLVPFSPFGYGYGYGYGGGGGGGLLFTLMLLGMLAFVAYEASQGGVLDESLDDRITVARVQIGLLGLARQLQPDLDRIAARADTSAPSGLKYVLEETVLALMRNPDYMVYGGSATMVVRGPEEAEDYFNSFSMQERGKFTEETLVNIAGQRKSGVGRTGSPGISNEYIVVTILVAADGKFKLPRCRDLAETKEALTKIGSLRASSLQAVEVLWQPQAMGDALTRDELVRDYPSLNIL